MNDRKRKKLPFKWVFGYISNWFIKFWQWKINEEYFWENIEIRKKRYNSIKNILKCVYKM